MQYVYIHGFGTTGKESTKFQMVLDYARKHNYNAYALEWHPLQANIIEDLIRQLNDVIDYTQPICFIGSSTGGNFCIQLFQKLPQLKKYTSILINPFVALDQRKIDDERFPISLADQMDVSTDQFNKSIVLLGTDDEVLDAQFTNQLLHKKHEIVWISGGNHSLNDYLFEHFETHLHQVIS
jgi:predicted esterase YcpF (UPF0227 family)